MPVLHYAQPHKSEIMTSEPQVRRRIALGIFKNFDMLHAAVAEFASKHIPTNEIMLVVGEKAKSTWLNEPLNAVENAINILPWPHYAGALESDHPLRKILQNSKGQQYAHAGNWITRSLSDDLVASLNSGSAILAVQISTASEELTVSKILLHNSSARIQVHDA